MTAQTSINPTSLLFLFFNTSEEGHTMELMDWIGAGILYFNRTGRMPPTPEIESPKPPPVPKIEAPKPLYAAVVTERSFIRNQDGVKVGEILKGSNIEVWEEASTIAGYEDRAVIDPPNASVRRNLFARNIRRL